MHNTLARAGLLFPIAVFSCCVFAETVGENQTVAVQAPAPAPVAGLSSSNYVEVLFGLILVVALIYACAWLIKRLNGGAINSAGKMRILGGISLGTRERIMLVDVLSQHVASLDHITLRIHHWQQCCCHVRGSATSTASSSSTMSITS